MDDIKYMKLAFQLSKKGVGFTEPNPLVGAVLVKDNRLLATGYHARYGTAHAEQAALRPVSETDTTLYVTLEPCAHYGKTPPCCDLLTQKKVRRVVVAVQDPNPLVNGKGIAHLKSHGVQVEVGLLRDMALTINRHYFKYITSNLPYVTIHGGVSTDGKLTDKDRHSKWITDEWLRQISHSVRGEFSAILVGRNTVLDDNPHLTLREPAWGNKTLMRVVLDAENALTGNWNIFKNREAFPLVIFSSSQTSHQTPNANANHHFFVSPGSNPGELNLVEVLEQLHRLGIASVLVEGGGRVIDSFLKSGLYDEVLLFTADTLIGGKASVELLASGVPVSNPVSLAGREITALESGYILRAYRQKQ
ncbi:MAG: bifunctional diaminohydroxyphosphoribosylaminopyrimidine deaminase/5-amino-6-(5-phosphoribosylamino)uracil reductase RibD [Candidatus Omnitrophota bacterium]